MEFLKSNSIVKKICKRLSVRFGPIEFDKVFIEKNSRGYSCGWLRGKSKSYIDARPVSRAHIFYFLLGLGFSDEQCNFLIDDAETNGYSEIEPDESKFPSLSTMELNDEGVPSKVTDYKK